MRNRVAALVAIGALLTLAAVVARGTSAVPVGQGRPLLGFLPFPQIQVPPAPPPSDRDLNAEPSDWVVVIGWFVALVPLVLLAALMVTALVLGVISMRRRRIGLPSPVVAGTDAAADETAHSLLRAARDARAIMREREQRGGAPSDAVIAAWLRLEHAAADSGVGRRAHQTPTEFTDVLLARHDAIQPALDELRRLYQRARFATTATVGVAEADAARAALDEIVHALTMGPVPT